MSYYRRFIVINEDRSVIRTGVVPGSYRNAQSVAPEETFFVEADDGSGMPNFQGEHELNVSTETDEHGFYSLKDGDVYLTSWRLSPPED